jgi:Peptidase family M48
VQVWCRSRENGRAVRSTVAALLSTLLSCSAFAQLCPLPERVPANLTADAAFAARVRSILIPQTLPATGPYTVGRRILQRLIQSLPSEKATVNWDLRIARDAGNIFSSPDGTIFVDETLAQFLGSQAGLWAAALSHEITHVVRRDWARRYVLQRSVEDDRASQIVLGTVAVSSGAWVDPMGSSAWVASCNRLMELEADAGSLTLMAQAGFHPDFVPALHHALEAQPVQLRHDLRDPSHPRWDVRDEKLQKLLVAASKEYDRMWPARYASPGGNPPVVVYAGAPAAKTLSEGDTQVLIPLNCQNLAGSVEVVLQLNENEDPAAPAMRQVTGCTSKRTLITFLIPPYASRKGHSHLQGEVSILNDRGGVLTRTLAQISVH